MSIFIKKVFFFPLLLFSVFLPILFLSGCFWGVQGDSVSLTYKIGELTSSKRNKKFERLIGASKPYNKTTVFGAEVVKSLLGTKNSSDDFKKKIFAYKFGQSSDFWNDYINSKGRFTQIENKFEALDHSISFDNGKNTIPTPKGWKYIEDKKIITIEVHIIKMTYGAPTKQGNFAEKWEITVKLEELSFRGAIAADKLSIKKYKIKEIDKIKLPKPPTSN